MGYGRTFLVIGLAVLLSSPQEAAAPLEPTEQVAAQVKTVSVPKLPVQAKPTGETPSSARRLAKTISRNREWNSVAEWRCLDKLWYAESRWNYKSANKHSSAYGIAQMLNTPKHWSPEKQIRKGLRYIEKRYETPCNAWKHFTRHHWY